MLEGRRLGIELSQVSAERPPSAGADLEPPAHWDLDAMVPPILLWTVHLQNGAAL